MKIISISKVNEASSGVTSTKNSSTCFTSTTFPRQVFYLDKRILDTCYLDKYVSSTSILPRQTNPRYMFPRPVCYLDQYVTSTSTIPRPTFFHHILTRQIYKPVRKFKRRFFADFCMKKKFLEFNSQSFMISPENLEKTKI